ncbi:MAG: hypothetical protein AB7N76_33320 [Planctomycetota bacterium]
MSEQATERDPAPPYPAHPPTQSPAERAWLRAGLVLLVLFGALTRLPAPWRMDVLNDELHHLESWRNRYRTDDVYPHFLRRVRAATFLSDATKQRVERFYASGPLAQRALIALVDPQPPLFPVAAELIEASTRSSLLALRLPSLVASLLAIALAFLLGRELRGPPLGLWMALLVAAGALVQLYAGIGRPYAWSHAALIGVALAFAHDARRVGAAAREGGELPSPGRLLAVALLAQTTQWLIWPVIGALLLAALLARRAAGPRRLLGWTWWYALGSLLLLGEMLVHLKNPTISGQSGAPSLATLWTQVALGGPFGALSGRAPGWPTHLAGLAFALALGAGVAALWRDRAVAAPLRLGLGLALAAALLSPVLAGSRDRFMVGYLVVPTLVAAWGLRWLLGRRALPAACLTLGALLLWSAARPLDPYAWFPRETRWSEVAGKLVAQRDGAPWTVWPYFFGDCLYPYRGDLPEPIHQDDPQAFRRWLAAPRPGTWLLIHARQRADFPELEQQSELRETFVNGYELRWLPARPAPAR